MIAPRVSIPVSASGHAPEETFVLNLGPQHPAAHGVLRVLMTMDGEWIKRAEPIIGYIHRMHEKMGENRSWAKFLPNPSRIDYLSAMQYTHAFVGAVERGAKIEVPLRAVVRTRVPRAQPELPTISTVFPGANWHERETHDFFGIRFLGHPNLKPLLLPEDATFHPPRKDYQP